MLYRNFIGGLILLFGSQFAVAASSFEQMVDAVKTDKPDVVNSLLKRGFDPNTSDREGNTLLMMAAKEGSNGVVKQLLAAQAKVQSVNEFGADAGRYRRPRRYRAQPARARRHPEPAGLDTAHVCRSDGPRPRRPAFDFFWSSRQRHLGQRHHVPDAGSTGGSCADGELAVG